MERLQKNEMKTLTRIIVVAVIAFFGSCAAGSESYPDENSTGGQGTNEIEAEKGKTPVTEWKDDKDADAGKRANLKQKAMNLCLEVDTGDKFLLKPQTFPIDFKPFENSCFVTAYDPEYEDPPLGSEISIYKDGKKVYEFDSRYNPDAATCWVEAVSFEDLTDDGLIDVIVAGKCGAKSGPIQGNEVFINTGKAFYSNIDANDKLEGFSKVKDIANFVRENKQLFSVR